MKRFVKNGDELIAVPSPEKRVQKALRNRKEVRIVGADLLSVFISFCLCLVIVAGFYLVSDRFAHWFVVPVLLCGTLIGIDAVEWFRGRIDTFDPVGLLGLLGFHFFFLAPLLHVYLDYWMKEVTPPPDWRIWLGGMALLNLLGLLVYRFTRNLVSFRSGAAELRQTTWIIKEGPFFTALAVAMLAGLTAQVFVYYQFGGLGGFFESYTERWSSSSSENPGVSFLRGMGWLFTISDSFPILGLLGFAVLARKVKLGRSWLIILLVLIVFTVLELPFGGLIGQRSNMVWGLLWAVGIIHFWIRPVPKRLVCLGLGFLMLFMYFYGFYKSAGIGDIGVDAPLKAVQSSEYRTAIEQRTGRTLDAVVLGDFGRSDVQAFLLYRVTNPRFGYEYAWGRTYLGAASLLIPEAVWPERPPTKVKEGTEVLFGMGTYGPDGPGSRTSSKLYGIAGEGLLNFGVLAVPLAFGALGLLVGWVRRQYVKLRPYDARLLLLPLLVTLCMLVLANDSDNALFYLVKTGSVPFLVILIGSKRSVERLNIRGGS